MNEVNKKKKNNEYIDEEKNGEEEYKMSSEEYLNDIFRLISRHIVFYTEYVLCIKKKGKPQQKPF